jgi:pimeloyl-ACP methyl ester carboxylesterase
MKRIHLTIATLLTLIAAGCSNDEAGTSGGVAAVEPHPPGPSAKSTSVAGAFGSGSRYALHCPADWNGDLVVYAHGYAFPETDPALPDADDESFVGLRDALLDAGYGVAFSSFSETGWAVHVGINETRQLRGLFTSRFGTPARTFLMGRSMGGLIAVALAERNPKLFDGALPMCGVLGGTDMAVEYIYNVRLLFDVYYPGVLPGSVTDVPVHWSIIQGNAYQALMADPLPAFGLAAIDQVNIQYASPEELFEAILTALVFHAASYDDMYGRTHNHQFFDNTDVWYSGSGDDEALNAMIPRFEATADAENYIERWYEPSGRVQVPTVTLHTTRDPVVQIFNEDDYRAKAEMTATDDLLHQYEIDRFGHCAIALDEILTAFNELVAWSDVLDGASANRPR